MSKDASGFPEEKLVGVDHSTRCKEMRKKMSKFINSVSIQFVLFVFTVYALLGDDIRLLLLTKESD